MRALNIRYQIKASAGMQYVKILVSQITEENSDVPAAAPVKKENEPEKNRRKYRIRASIYIPITLFLYYNMYYQIDHIV
jgi:hypothetical protein